MSILHNTLKLINIKIKKNLDYLELGFLPIENSGNNFLNVDDFKSKTSVDIECSLATYHMSTDDFFKHNQKKYDIIYIDAGHECHQVIKDYNNSVKFLKKNGIIVIHDLYPPNESMTIPGYCGDGYKVLNYFKENDYNYYTYIPDMGLTIVLNNAPININDFKNIDYNYFITFFKMNNTRYTEILEEWIKFFIKNV